MSNYVSIAATRGRRAIRALITSALALGGLALLFAGSASAQPFATRLDVTGMTTPAGVVATPDGDLWISDALMGVCRVTAQGLETSGLCALQPPDVEAPPAPPGTRPTGTGQIAFDPQTSNLYVAEGTSSGSGIWRMHLSPVDHGIDGAVKIFESTRITRIEGLALTASGDVVFSDKETSAIRRLDSPATLEGAGTFAENVGFSINKGVRSLTVLGQVVYLADGGTVTSLAPRGSGLAVPIPGQQIDPGFSALAADPVRGAVYAGTATLGLTDAVFSISGDVFSAGTYDRGFTNITAMAVGPAGALYIVQDPNGALSPSTDPTGQAELYRRDFGPLVTPDARLISKPDAAQQSGVVTFTFDALNGTDDTHFECTLDGTAVDCPTTGRATGAYTQPTADELAEGVHTFTVRAANEPAPTTTDWGPTVTYAFRVDRTAPTVTIDAPSSHTAPGAKLRLFFSADEPGVGFTCQVDDGAPAPCDPPRDLALAPGEHTIAVRATDAAQNTGPVATWDVTALAPAPAAPASTPTTPAPPPAAVVVPQPAPVAVAPQPRVPQIASGVPCAAVSATSGAARMHLSGRKAVVRFRAPARARYAKLTLRHASVIETLAYARIVRAGATHVVHVSLTRRERLLVRTGRARLAIAFGTCRTRVGRSHTIPNAVEPEGNR